MPEEVSWSGNLFNTFVFFDVSGCLSFLFSACQVVGCLLLFCSWSFSTLLLAFSFAGGDVGDIGDDSDHSGGDFDNHDGDDSDIGGSDIDNHDVFCRFDNRHATPAFLFSSFRGLYYQYYHFQSCPTFNL